MAPLIYLVAGEASGDALGAKLMQALQKLHPDVRFAGVGGAQMQAAGLQSLFPLSDIAHMGFVEVLPHIPKVLSRIRDVVADVRDKRPAVVITIDAQAFSRRIAKALQRERQQGLKLIHYVAPSVWAYKPERARWFAKLYDHMLCLLPFEPPYFDAVGLANSFVGHPVLEEALGEGEAFRRRHNIKAEIPLLGLFPGSRMAEITRHLPLYRAAIENLRQQIPSIHCAMLVAPHLREAIARLTQDWPSPLIRVEQWEEKTDLMAACDAALTKSGTITLELALAGLPMVVAHRAHPLSVWLARRLIKVKYVTLVNLLENQEIVPELLQENATPERISQQLYTFLGDEDARTTQCTAMREALRKLMPKGGQTPSAAAAAIVLRRASLNYRLSIFLYGVAHSPF